MSTTSTEAPFGELLRRFRESAGLTQEMLAERAGLTVNAIGALERGERRRPYPHTVRALADALTLSAAQHAELVGAATQRAVRPPAAEPAPTGASALPSQLTELIGRTAEVGVIGQLLARKDVRLLTITGPGGVGKTRLALEAAARVGADFGDGVMFIALAPIGDPTLVLPTIAQSLGLQETVGLPALRSLGLWLRDKHQLLLLDNFEHVAAAAPQLAELLGECPQLKLLATSREALRIRGEQEYLLPPLAFPQIEDLPLATDLARFDAIRLFVRRAQSVRPDFELTDANGRSIAEICARLDGLPLAIELAAARSALLSPATLLARLARQLHVLTGGARDLPARQQTMRDTIAWSYDLLAPAERLLFCRLAIFAGGATLEAIEAVCGTGFATADDVLELLASLVQKSLVRRDEQEGELRVTMLETIRAFGLEQIQSSGDADRLADAHAQYFLALAEQASPYLTRGEQIVWVRSLSAEINNLRAAVRWWLERAAWANATRLAWALWRFWWIRGLHLETHSWMHDVLEHAPPDALSEQHRAQAELLLGGMAWASGDNDEALIWCERGVLRARSQADQRTEAIGLMLLGAAAMTGGAYNRGTEWLEKSAQLFFAIEELWGAGFAMSYTASVEINPSNPAKTSAALEAALTVARRSGDRIVTHQILYRLGIMAAISANYPRATRAYAEGLTLAGELQDIANIGYFIKGIAELAALLGNAARGVRLLSAAHALLEAVAVPLYRYAMQRDWHGEVVAHARLALGAAAFDRSWNAGRTLGVEPARAEAHALAADLLAQLEQAESS